jgi:hypothetical protein
MLKLHVRQPVQMRMQHIYEDLKKEKTVQCMLLNFSKDNKDVFFSVSLHLGIIFSSSVFIFLSITTL